MADKYFDDRLSVNGRQSHIDLDNRFNLTQHIRTTIANGPSTQLIAAVIDANAITDGSTAQATMTNTIAGYMAEGYTKLHIVCNTNETSAITIPLIAISTLPVQLFAGAGPIIFTATFNATTTVTFGVNGDDTSDQAIYIS